MMSPRTTHLLLGCALALAACAQDERGEATGAVCPDVQTLTYESFGRDFFRTYCNTCHSRTLTGAARKGAPSDHDFDSLLDIRVNGEHIDALSASGPRATNAIMPSAGARPTLEERQKLGEWLACGAPGML